VSLFDALGEWMGYAAYYAAYGGSAPPASGAHHASIAPYGPFRAGDGQVVYLAVQNAREWARFCADVLDRPELADDTRFSDNAARVRHRTALHEIIHEAFTALAGVDVIDRLNRADIANARMNSVQGFLEHPQLSARQRWANIGSPAGPLRTLLPPVIIDGVEPHLADVPALGQHTDAILAELGIDAATIASWHKHGTI
jgi:crotonobetainyl-CoA:carnitine CoA-transferase CaiB-like acyl-CoA transferase